MGTSLVSMTRVVDVKKMLKKVFLILLILYWEAVKIYRLMFDLILNFLPASLTTMVDLREFSKKCNSASITIYAPIIYTTLCIMFWIRAYP